MKFEPICSIAGLFLLALVQFTPALASLGSGCVDQSWCTVENSWCNPSGFCRCVEGFTEIYGACYKLPVHIDGPCTDDVHCPTNGYCSGLSIAKSCQCRSEAIPSSNRTACLRLATSLGQQCREEQVCSSIPNAECMDGYCVCSAGHVPAADQGSCLRMAVRLNDLCTENLQCTTLLGATSLCAQAQARCYCKYGQVSNAERNRCYPVVNSIGDQCEIDEQCRLGLGSSSKCRGKFCVCSGGSEGNSEGTECVSIE